MTSQNQNFFCPITQSVMTDPVIGSDGITYERTAIEAWLVVGHGSPTTRQPMSRASLVPNYALKAMIEDSLKSGPGPGPGPGPVPVPRPGPRTSDAPITIEAAASSGPGQGRQVHIRLSTPETVAGGEPLLVIDVLDISGSMGNSSMDTTQKSSDAAGFSRSDLVRHAVATQIELLRPYDELAVVLFDDKAVIALEPTPLNHIGRLGAKTCLPQITPTGGTSIWTGLQKALSIAERPAHVGKNIVIILQTDGESDASLNPPRGIPDTFRSWRDAHPAVKITLHTVGYGFGAALDMPLLRVLAEIGNGTVNYIPDGSMVGTVFIHMMANLMSCQYRGVKIHIPSEGRCIPVGFLQGGQSRDFVLTLPEDVVARPLTIDVTADNTTTVTSLTFENLSTSEPLDAFTIIHAQLLTTLQEALMQAVNGSLQWNSDPLATLVAVCRLNAAADPTGRIAALLTDLADPDPYKGQVGKAFASKEAFTRWGRHYIPTYLCGQKNQWPINFKDEGSKIYGSATTKALIDHGDTIFNSLPPPTASCSYAVRGGGGGPVSMASVNSSSGPCFLGASRVKMADGTEKRCDEIKAGDVVAAGYVIGCVVKTLVTSANIVRLEGHLRPEGHAPLAESGGFTAWHPVFDYGSNSWKHPATLGQAETVVTDAIYNFVLKSDENEGEVITETMEKPGVLIINGLMTCTLGHEYQGPVIGHPYFGTEAVINDLEKMPGFADGLVVLDPATSTFSRDPVTGLVDGLVRLI